MDAYLLPLIVRQSLPMSTRSHCHMLMSEPSSTRQDTPRSFPCPVCMVVRPCSRSSARKHAGLDDP
eukprot:1470590-Rhodomonas_salina.1